MRLRRLASDHHTRHHPHHPDRCLTLLKKKSMKVSNLSAMIGTCLAMPAGVSEHAFLLHGEFQRAALATGLALSSPLARQWLLLTMLRSMTKMILRLMNSRMVMRESEKEVESMNSILKSAVVAAFEALVDISGKTHKQAQKL